MNNCPICFNLLDNNQTCITNCNHIFCIQCLEEWINKKRIDCPTCRQIIKQYKHNNFNNKIIIFQNEQIIQNNILLEIKYHKLYKSFKLYRFLSIIFSIFLIYYINCYNSINDEYNLLNNKYNKCNYNNSLINSNLIKTNLYIVNQLKSCYIPYF